MSHQDAQEFFDNPTPEEIELFEEVRELLRQLYPGEEITDERVWREVWKRLTDPD